jgi:hypothetical protein
VQHAAALFEDMAKTVETYAFHRTIGRAEANRSEPCADAEVDSAADAPNMTREGSFHPMDMDRIAGQLRAAAAGHAFSARSPAERIWSAFPRRAGVTCSSSQGLHYVGCPRTASPLERGTGRRNVTAHGYRTSFRTWCSEVAHVEFELAELCLSHRIGSAISLAYNRTTMTERRRPIMSAWANYIEGDAAANVVPFRAAAGE